MSTSDRPEAEHRQPAADEAAPGAARGRSVPCPTCGAPALFAPANPWRPFCSERCRRVDLGAWASEGYRVPAKPPADGERDDGPAH